MVGSGIRTHRCGPRGPRRPSWTASMRLTGRRGGASRAAADSS